MHSTLELVNKQTVNEKYWNAQVALYKRATWYSPVSNLLTRGTTAPTHLSTILPLYVQEVSKCTNICKFLLKNMIIQSNNNIRRLISKHLKGQLAPRVSDVTFLDQMRSVGAPRQ